MSTPANFNGPDATTVPPPLQETLAPAQAELPRRKGLSATSLLIIGNTLIFYAMLACWIYVTDTEKVRNTVVFARFDSELMLRWGSDYGPLTLTGQFWRILTSTFVHFNFLHLTSNMLFLWGLGRYLDRFFTRAQALAIFLLTGAAASTASLIWDPLVNSAGASGAIYGQAGVLIALLCFARLNFSRRDIRNLLLWIFFSMPIGLLWGHVSKHTDYAGHIGGILCGLVIGALLAPSFRLPEAKYAVLQRAFLRLAAVTLVFVFAAVTQLRRTTVMAYLDTEPLPTTSSRFQGYSKPRIARIFLDLKGDTVLVHRFSAFLNLELENNGIAMVGREPDADAVLHGEIHALAAHKDLDVHVLRVQVITQNAIEKIDSCAALTKSEGAVEIFSPSEETAATIRKKHPNARTVRFDPANEKTTWIQFGSGRQIENNFLPQLQSELKKSGLTLVDSAPSDIMLSTHLASEKVPVQEDLATYELKLVARNGAPLYSSNGAGIQFAKLPQGRLTCSQQLADMEWLYKEDPLFQAVRQLTRNLQTQDATPANK